MIADSVLRPDRFAELYERHLDAVAAYLTRRVGGDLAEDLAAEVFVRAFRGRASFRSEHATARPWLLGIASHVVGDHRRAERRRLALLARVVAIEPQAAHVEVGGLSADLVERLRRLPSVERDTLLLVAWGELSYQEAADVLAVPLGTVRSRIARARDRLSAGLGDAWSMSEASSAIVEGGRMSSREPWFESLRSLRDVGVTPPARGPLRERVAAAVQHEIDAAARSHNGARVRGLRRRIRAADRIVPLITVCVAIGVGLVALELRSQHPHGGRRHASGAQGLIARLAVLRRPQTPADKLPPHLRLPSDASLGSIIPPLTRLIANPPGAKLYLVVTTPPAARSVSRGGELWSPDLGDQVALVVITRSGVSETPGQPAADLTNSLELTDAGDVGSGHAGIRHAWVRYTVGVVPDGVAGVDWTYRILRTVYQFTVTTRATVVLHPRVADNVAYSPASAQLRTLQSGSWYAADGSPVRTSDRALRQAIATRNTSLRAQALRTARSNHYRADPRLLDAFPVFAVTSPTGVRLGNGVIISYPPLEKLPLQILNALAPNDVVTEPDPTQVRQVTMRSGLRFWVIPGHRGLCVFAIETPEVPQPVSFGEAAFASGGAESCAPTIKSALAEGSGIRSLGLSGTTIYAIRPHTRPSITIQTGPHSYRTISSPGGVSATHVAFR